MKKILFPTDYSETANNAFIYALNIAKKYDAMLYVLHVYQNPIISSRIPPVVVQDTVIDSELRPFEDFKESSSFLHKILEREGASDVDMKLVLKEGYFTDTIKEFVDEEKDIDLVVMGTNGSSSYLERAFFGSNTVSAIKNLEIPVISIPQQAKYSDLKSIVFTTLFKEKDKNALNYLVKIAERFGAKIHCLHVVSKDKSDISTILNSWKSDFLNKPVIFEVLDSNENVNKTILKYVDNNKIDLMASVPRNLNFFEDLFSPSFTKTMSYEAKVPIFVVKF